MKKLISPVIVVLLLIIGSHLFAEEKNWSDEAELSFVDTGGNTETTSLSAKNQLKYKFTEKLSGTWKLAILYGEKDGEKSAERYSTELRTDYLFTKRLYIAVMGGWEKNKFEDIDARYSLGPALGYKFLLGPVHFLNFEAGFNYVIEKYIDETDDNFLKGRAFGEYNYAFSKKNKFKQTLETLFDLEDANNYDVNSETSLITSISDQFSLKTSYVIEYDNEPASDDIEKTDTFLSVTLVVSF